METTNFEIKTFSDDVDIKHEPLEPDVEHYNVGILTHRSPIYIRNEIPSLAYCNFQQTHIFRF